MVNISDVKKAANELHDGIKNELNEKIYLLLSYSSRSKKDKVMEVLVKVFANQEKPVPEEILQIFEAEDKEFKIYMYTLLLTILNK